MSSGTDTEYTNVDWRPEVSRINDDAAPTRKFTWMQHFTRRKMMDWLGGLQGGQIQFSDAQTGEVFGPWDSPLCVSWQVNHPSFYSLLASQGAIGLAESYLRGYWQVDDLTTFIQILCRNLERTSSLKTGLSAITGYFRRLGYRFDSNSRSGSRRHIAAHYDLSNAFFELFLDPTMMYSSAWFEHDRMSLHEASLCKLERLCGKLDLQASDRVLEIGTGWGGFSLYAAKHIGCHVTTTTISPAQFEMTNDRVRHAGLNNRIKALSSDYRDLEGRYDKLVSIEVIEAIGERHLDEFFRKSNELLKPGGRCVMQAIVMPEQRYDTYRRGVDFIQKYIFPGGFLPSIVAIQQSAGRMTSFRLQSVEDMSRHYAETIMHWRAGFLDQLDEVRKLGFDDRFIRMWEYYLCYCEAAFREDTARVVQIVWDKTQE